MKSINERLKNNNWDKTPELAYKITKCPQEDVQDAIMKVLKSIEKSQYGLMLFKQLNNVLNNDRIEKTFYTYFKDAIAEYWDAYINED